MPSYQKTTIMGHLGRDVDTTYSASGTAISKFSVAVGEKWKDKTTGETQEHTEWFNCTAFGFLAEFLSKGKKGGLVFVEGRLRTRTYTKKDGSDGKATELLADKGFLLAAMQLDGHQKTGPDAHQKKPAVPEFDDDIPF